MGCHIRVTAAHACALPRRRRGKKSRLNFPAFLHKPLSLKKKKKKDEPKEKEKKVKRIDKA